MSQPNSQFGQLCEHEIEVRGRTSVDCEVAAKLKLDELRGRAGFIAGSIDGPYVTYGGFAAWIRAFIQARLPDVSSPPLAPEHSASGVA